MAISIFCAMDRISPFFFKGPASGILGDQLPGFAPAGGLE
jgi:hypothetical protein